uniref:Uncharacterized protein n=1 Tax=Spongospora subterranea TaxID=70186 RepID=A0A0H5RUT2_9EUKA|eukprot:CRZ12509.1 hypothetical protein [Spongospora subterranea]
MVALEQERKSREREMYVFASARDLEGVGGGSRNIWRGTLLGPLQARKCGFLGIVQSPEAVTLLPKYDVWIHALLQLPHWDKQMRNLDAHSSYKGIDDCIST